ncbi:hypothetical protein BJX99DRAFT_256613 [Aspergillus californicus]
MRNLSEEARRLKALPAYHLALGAIKPGSYEEPVQDLWKAIVNTYFSWHENYRNKSTGANQANDIQPNVKVIQIMAAAADPVPQNASDWDERQILQVECKRPSVDDDVVTGRFVDDLIMSINASRKLYEAVAIGTKVKFFKFDGNKLLSDPDILIELHTGKIDLTEASHFPHFAHWLDLIKREGFQWAF